MTHKPIYVEDYNFLRPPVDLADLNDNSKPFTFYITDVDETNSITTQWEVEKRLDDTVRPNYWGYFVRLFGIDEAGHSVSVYVNGFKPFVYVQAPREWEEDDMCRAIENGLEMVANMENKKFTFRDICRVTKTWRVNAFGFTNFEQVPVFKIEFHCAFKRKLFISLCDVSRTWCNYENLNHEFWLFDTDLEPLEQFSNDQKVRWSHWVTIAADAYSFHDSKVARGNILLPQNERRSRCQIDLNCQINSIKTDLERSDLPKFLFMSYDIEVKGRPGFFPEPSEATEPVITIGVTVQRIGDGPNKYVSQACFCLLETENLRPDDVKLYYFKSEAHMLEAYFHYWTDCVDADIITGYNTNNFDGLYLYNRYMKLLQHMIPKDVLDGTASYFNRGVLDYGKIRNSRGVMKGRETFSRAHGGSEKYTIEMPGRIDLDLMTFAREEWKLIVGLNSLAALFLDDAQKDPIHFSQITPMFLKGPHERGLLAKYCVRDTELPLMVIEKKSVLIDQVEKSRLTGVSLNVMINRKQTVRVATLLKKAAFDSEERYSFPEQPFRFVKDPHILALFNGEHGKEGALVLKAEADFYAQPIATLDFAGLYPSIVRGYGLCYTTLVLDPKYLSQVETRKDVVRNKIVGAAPYEFHWATLPGGRKSLLYKILTSVLDARSNAKKELKRYAEGTFNWNVVNSRQLTLKLIANSIYGFTVVDPRMNKYSCYPIGITVTHFGRQMIQTTKAEVMRRIPGSKVIYGDTDSVMIKFSEDDSKEAFEAAFVIGRMLAKEISKLFPKECVLEFEKVFYPYSLYQQKNYAGIRYTDAKTEGTVKCAGLASVKSDTIEIVRRWTDDIMALLLVKRNHHAAKLYLINNLIQFVRNKVPASDVSISIKLSKEIDQYAGENEVKQVAQAIAKRDPGQTPRAGHKITFLHCLDRQHGNQRVPVDIEYYKANTSRYQVDKFYYLHNLMTERIGKLFDLTSMAYDPYQWFAPFENALVLQKNGGGIQRFLSFKKTDEQQQQTSELTIKDVLPDEKPISIQEEALNDALNELQIIQDDDDPAQFTSDAETKFEEKLAKKMQELAVCVDNFQEDSEFPLSMFKDTEYSRQSKFKTNRLKKVDLKELKDESRRLEIPLETLKKNVEKRKYGTPISNFFKVRKLND